MAVVSKKEIRIFDNETFIKVIKFSADTERFTIDLPDCVHEKVGEKVDGETLKEVNAKFSHVLELYREASTSKTKVILVRLEATVTGDSPFDQKHYDLDDIGYSNEGAAVSLAFGVFEKHITDLSAMGMSNKKDYVWVDVEVPEGFEGLQEQWSLNDNEYVELPWTQEYENMFIELGGALRILVFKLLSIVKNKKTIDKFIVSGQKLLPEQQN